MDVAILAVKPQILPGVLQEVAPAVAGRLLISVAAGVATRTIRGHLPPGVRLIRTMPNAPALVLEGATAIARAEGLEAGDLDTAQEIFAAVGKVVVLEEELMDAVTGLSGSGPAYLAVVIEALADGGVRVGLDRQTAMTLAAQTVLGSARLLIETGIHPGQLKDMVDLPRRDGHRRDPHAGGGRPPADADRRRGAGDPAVARAGARGRQVDMFVARELLMTIAWLIDYLLWIYMWIIIIRALISWVNPDPWNPIVRFLYQVTEPVLRPIRRLLPNSAIDFSPLIVILVIMVLQRFVPRVLVEAAYRLS